MTHPCLGDRTGISRDVFQEVARQTDRCEIREVSMRQKTRQSRGKMPGASDVSE